MVCSFAGRKVLDRFQPPFSGHDAFGSGTAGKLWDKASLAVYVTDPSAWLKDATGDAAAKSNKSFKLTKGSEDMAAYLVSLEIAPAGKAT